MSIHDRFLLFIYYIAFIKVNIFRLSYRKYNASCVVPRYGLITLWITSFSVTFDVSICVWVKSTVFLWEVLTTIIKGPHSSLCSFVVYLSLLVFTLQVMLVSTMCFTNSTLLSMSNNRNTYNIWVLKKVTIRSENVVKRILNSR